MSRCALGGPVKRGRCAVNGNEGSGSRKAPDPSGIERNVGLDGKKQSTSCIKYIIPTEIIAEAMKNIRKEALGTVGKSVVPLQSVDTELVDKYQSSFKGMQCHQNQNQRG